MRSISSLPVYLALAALLVIGAYLRVHGATEYHYNSDEAEIANISGATTLPQVIAFARYEVHPPLFYILCHYWMMISQNASFVRCLSLLFGLLTIVVFYLIGRAMNGHLTGLCCATLATFSHALIILSFSVRQYTSLMFFLACAFYYFVRLNRKPDLRKLLWYAAFSFAACMSHFSALLTIACIAVAGTLTLLRKRAKPGMHLSWIAVHLVIMGITLWVYLMWEPVLHSMRPFFDASAYRALSPIGMRLIVTLSYPFIVGDYFFPAGIGVPAMMLLIAGGLICLSAHARASQDMHRFLLLAFIALALGMALMFTGYYPHLGARHSTWLLPIILPAAASTFIAFATWISRCAHDNSPARFIPSAAVACLAVTSFLTYDAQVRFRDTREYALTEKEWSSLHDNLNLLTAREVILTERDDGMLLTSLYAPLHDIPFTHSTDFMFAPYLQTRILFNPYYARSYTKSALFSTLRQAEEQGELAGVDTVVFYHTFWSRSPIVDLLRCPGAVSKTVTFPTIAVKTYSPDAIDKLPAALLFIPKQTLLNAGAAYEASGKVCS